jgi:uncharacterized protein (UPF0261 family)
LPLWALALHQPAHDVAGVLGIGGGGGTSIVTAGMRALPIGVPKLMVSTLASGDVGPFVDVSDIAMMYSVTDIAGLNRISRAVLTNAAAAIVGMARAPAPAADAKPAIGLTMFGVTTPCVTRAAEALRADYDCVVFHATGSGGRAMEKLVEAPCLSRARRHDDGGLRSAARRRAERRPGPAGRHRAHARSLCRVGWRTGHGELLGT